MQVRVYPEYFNGNLLSREVEIYGDLTDGFSRMKLLLNGVMKGFYDKVDSDGRNLPAEDQFKPFVYEINSVAIGMICCMDINNPAVYNQIKDALLDSKCQHKIIAISAYMTDRSWFNDCALQPYLHGFWVVLSNGCFDGPSSFIASPEGKKLGVLEIEFDGVKLTNCGVSNHT